MNKIKEIKTRVFKPRISMVLVLIAVLIGADLAFYSPPKVHITYLSLPEDIPAVQAGDTLWSHEYGDTTVLDFQPSQGAKPIIVLPN